MTGVNVCSIVVPRRPLTESGVERDLRDAIAGRIYSGTSEIQRVIIARMLGL